MNPYHRPYKDIIATQQAVNKYLDEFIKKQELIKKLKSLDEDN